MRDPKRIRPFLEKIAETWEKNCNTLSSGRSKRGMIVIALESRFDESKIRNDAYHCY